VTSEVADAKLNELETKYERAEEENGSSRGCFFPDTKFAPGRLNMLNFLT
jgi:hypothetical protein